MMERLLELYDIAERDGIIVDSVELRSLASISISGERGECCIAIDPFQLENTADETHKLAHELGHCKTGCFYSHHSLFELRERCEWRAEKWAFKQLVPKDELYSFYLSGLTEPWEIAGEMNLPESVVRKATEYYLEQELAG